MWNQRSLVSGQDSQGAGERENSRLCQERRSRRGGEAGQEIRELVHGWCCRRQTRDGVSWAKHKAFKG